MRRNKLFILGLFFAFVAVLSLTLVSGTWAKYTSNVTSASSTARVAKWSWEIDSESASEGFAFDLFKTADNVLDTANGIKEEDVKGEGDAVVIAPGTKGKIDLVIANKSEVTGKVVAEFTVTKPATLNLTYTFSVGSINLTPTATDNGSGSTTYKVTLDEETLGANLAALNGTATLTFAWEWPFEVSGNDGIDTELGKLGTNTVTVKAKLTFIQVD